MTECSCGDVECRRYDMTVAEFKILCGDKWPGGFDGKLGLAAKALCQKVHGSIPPLQRYRSARRNKVRAYPCGIIEQAYRLLRAPR